MLTSTYNALWLTSLFFSLNPIFEIPEFNFHNFTNKLTDKFRNSKLFYKQTNLPNELERLLMKSVISVFVLSNLVMVYLFFRPGTKNPILDQFLISLSLLGNTYSYYISLNNFKNHPVIKNLKKLAISLYSFKKNSNSQIIVDIDDESFLNIKNFTNYIFSDENNFSLEKGRLDLYAAGEREHKAVNLHITKNFILLTRKSVFTLKVVEFLPIVSCRNLPGQDDEQEQTTNAICVDAVFHQTINENYSLNPRNRQNQTNNLKQFVQVNFTWPGDPKCHYSGFSINLEESKFSNELKPNLEMKLVNVIILSQGCVDLGI